MVILLHNDINKIECKSIYINWRMENAATTRNWKTFLPLIHEVSNNHYQQERQGKLAKHIGVKM